MYLKAENLQRAGAFKFRGACNAVASLTAEERAAGVATVSSGNHAQALALAASLHGVTATILMPDDAPPNKLAATRGYGAEVIGFDRYAADREQLLAELVAERGLVPVHPYDDPRVMAGQGTVAMELLEQAGPLDVLLVCVGGGGLIAGCATAAAELAPDVRVIGVEPEAGDDTRRSLAAGERVRIPVPRTIADGQQLPIPGELTFEVVRRLVSRDRRRLRPGDRRRDAVPVRAPEDRRGAERRLRAGGAAGRPGGGEGPAGRRDDLRRQRRRGAVLEPARAVISADGVERGDPRRRVRRLLHGAQAREDAPAARRRA